MRILLPPSETKRTGGTGRLDPAALHEAARLGETRARVRAALEAVSADPGAAAKALKLGAKNGDERLRNLELATSGTLPALERYTGVLYDALDAPGLAAEARAWVDAHVLVQSALFGLVRAGDRIPAYRLSGGSRLPELGAPLKRVWAAAHADLDWGSGPVLDLRSQDYRALAPLPADAGRALHVAQRGPDGAVRALNHFNKAAKGDLVRRLATTGREVRTLDDLALWAAEEGLELALPDGPGPVTLVTALGAPQTA